jgi:hypothetical protein
MNKFESMILYLTVLAGLLSFGTHVANAQSTSGADAFEGEVLGKITAHVIRITAKVA